MKFILAFLLLYGSSMQQTMEDSVDAYWDAYIGADGTAYAEMVPDEYWEYISEAYDMSEEDCIAGMEEYLQFYSDSLGGDLTYEWEESSHEYYHGTDDSEVAEDAKEYMDTYGIDYTALIGVEGDAIIEGEYDYQSYPDEPIWLVKVDGTWYNLTAMLLFDAVCEAGYGQEEVVPEQEVYEEIVEKSWTAIFQKDIYTILNVTPPKLLEIMEDDFGIDTEMTEVYLESYLDEMLADTEIEDPDALVLEMTVTDAVDSSDEYLADFNDLFSEYGLEATKVMDVTMDYDAYYNGSVESNSEVFTVIQIDDTWYSYECIFFLLDACFNEGEYTYEDEDEDSGYGDDSEVEEFEDFLGIEV